MAMCALNEVKGMELFMKKKKSINDMNYDELHKRKDQLLFERFLGIILSSALLLGVLILIMIKDISLLDAEFVSDYIRWNLSAYALLGLGALGLIQIFLSTIDYHRCLSKIKKQIDNGTSY